MGLDTLAHVVNTMRDTLPHDPWHRYFTVPDWMQGLIDAGALGEKVKRGVYQKINGEIHVLDLATQSYRLSEGNVDEDIKHLLKFSGSVEKFVVLRSAEKQQAQFLWAVFREFR